MKIVQALVGCRAADSLPYSLDSTPEPEAAGLKAEGYAFLAGYLGAMNVARVQALLSNGLGYSPVTFGGEYEDGADDEIAQLRALGIPVVGPGVARVTVWLDMEGLKAFKTDPVKLIGMINAWADKIDAAGYMPGLYVGVPQPLTSDELWNLRVRRYWKGQGSVRDRHNQLAEPTGCGWCMTQMWPSIPAGGTKIDANIVGQDYKGRVPNIVVA